VNGQTATVDDSYANDDGTYNWSADQVPIYGMGTATFDASATPATGSGLGMARARDDDSGSGAANTSLAVEMGPMLTVTHYNFTEANSEEAPLFTIAVTRTMTYDGKYAPDANGQWRQTYQATETEIARSSEFGVFTNAQTWSDPEPFYPVGFYGADVDVDVGGETGGGYAFSVSHNFAKLVHHHWDYGHFGDADVTVNADTHWTLYTGGKAVINPQGQAAANATSRGGPQNLFAINVTADSYEGSPYGPEWYGAPINGVAAADIQVLGEILENDFTMLTSLPANAAVDLGMIVLGKNDAGSGAAEGEYTPTITANGLSLSNNVVATGADFCVGQGITFDIAGMPPHYNPDDVVNWTLPGDFVNTNSAPDCDLFYEENAAFLNPPMGKTATHCWYVKQNSNPATVSVTVKYCRYDNSTYGVGPLHTLTLTGQFNIHRPTITLYDPYYHGAPQIQAAKGVLAVRHHDISFRHYIKSDFPGVAGYAQLVSGSWVTTPIGAPLDGTELDGRLGEFPRGQQSINPTPSGYSLGMVYFYDGPSISLSDVLAPTSEDLSFSTYLMFKPATSGSIFVPLRLVTWKVDDSATHNSDNTWTPSGSATITGQGDTTTFPEWTKIYTGGL